MQIQLSWFTRCNNLARVVYELNGIFVGASIHVVEFENAGGRLVNFAIDLKFEVYEESYFQLPSRN